MTINCIYYGGQFIQYTNVISLYCIPEANIIHVNYFSINKLELVWNRMQLYLLTLLHESCYCQKQQFRIGFHHFYPHERKGEINLPFYGITTFKLHKLQTNAPQGLISFGVSLPIKLKTAFSYFGMIFRMKIGPSPNICNSFNRHLKG